MRFFIPDFIPVPGPETMRLISVIALIAGICSAAAGMLFLFLSKRKGNGKTAAPGWIAICVGALLIANHGLQLLF